MAAIFADNNFKCIFLHQNVSSFGFAGGKLHQKITIPLFRLVLQNFAIPGCFPYILLYCYLFSLLSSGWFVIAFYCSISVRVVDKYLG